MRKAYAFVFEDGRYLLENPLDDIYFEAVETIDEATFYSEKKMPLALKKFSECGYKVFVGEQDIDVEITEIQEIQLQPGKKVMLKGEKK